MSTKYVLAIDQGTTSSRAILFDENLSPAFSAQQEFKQFFPQSGWVEHDPEEIWKSVKETVANCLAKAKASAADVVSIGITNQRETVVVWERDSGKPIHNAIVWQDRRTASLCQKLKSEEGWEEKVTHKTGLLSDPYFSATKLWWILENVDGARDRAEAGELLFGTIDSFLIWRMTKGASHVTDATNAARTMLFNIRDGAWDDELLNLFDIPQSMLPSVKNCADDFGTAAAGFAGKELPIRGVAGDQQAATIGQACFEPGMLKSTYGTGCFALLNTGDTLVESKNRLLGTIAYQFNGKPTYALEGSIFVAGAVVQWLRDGLQILADASETHQMADNADATENLIMVPAFTGLGAPYWRADARGAVFGITRNSGPKDFARAALESVGFQTRDLLDAMRADWGGESSDAILRVDGGMTANDWAMQFLSDIIDAPVDRPRVLETTALGAAWLAGSAVGFYPDQAEFAKTWAVEKTFSPKMAEDVRNNRYSAWQRAVEATLSV